MDADRPPVALPGVLTVSSLGEYIQGLGAQTRNVERYLAIRISTYQYAKE